MGSLVFLVLGTGTAWYWALSKGGQAAWFVAAFGGFLVAYALIVLSTAFSRMVVTREIVQSTVSDEKEITVTVRLKRTSWWFPLVWIVVTDALLRKDGSVVYSHQQLIFAGLKQHMTYTYSIAKLGRGVYTFTDLSIWTGEPLGFIGRNRRMAGTGGYQLTVYPEPLALRAVLTRSRGDNGDTAVLPTMMTESSLVGGVRDYAHGDPLQRIHWKSTARTGGLKTKELDALLSRRLTIVLDVAAKAYGGGKLGRARFETAASAVAAILQDAQRLGLGVSLRCGGQGWLDGPEGKPPGSSPRMPAGQAGLAAAAGEAPSTAERLALATLAAAEPSGSVSLAAELRSLAARLATDSSLMLVTPWLDEQLLESVCLLRARRVHVSLLLCGGSSDTAAPQAEAQQRLTRQLERMRCRVSVASGGEREARREMAGAAAGAPVAGTSPGGVGDVG